MSAGYYAKGVTNKTNGIGDITLFSLSPDSFYNIIHI